jgi:hypothetical protein
MAVPTAILEAARAGDRDRVLAWLDAPDVEETRDVNAVGETLGGRDLTLLMMVASRLDSETSLELARDLVRRGADVNHHSVPEDLRVIVVALGSLQNAGIGEFVRDFVILLIENGLEFDGLTASYPLSLFLPSQGQYSRFIAEIFFAMVRAGAPISHVVRECQLEETRYPALAHDEHWVSCRALAEGVQAAGGSWAGYRRMPRKEVLRLRSLVLRGRARARRTRGADPVVARVLRLPNELVWKVLDYWRCRSDITGEVI